MIDYSITRRASLCFQVLVIDYQVRQSIILSYRSFFLLKLTWAFDYQVRKLINSVLLAKFQVKVSSRIRILHSLHIWSITKHETDLYYITRMSSLKHSIPMPHLLNMVGCKIIKPKLKTKGFKIWSNGTCCVHSSASSTYWCATEDCFF